MQKWLALRASGTIPKAAQRLRLFDFRADMLYSRNVFATYQLRLDPACAEMMEHE